MQAPDLEDKENTKSNSEKLFHKFIENINSKKITLENVANGTLIIIPPNTQTLTNTEQTNFFPVIEESKAQPENAANLNSIFNWKNSLQNNNLFSQDIPYSYEKLLDYLHKTNENLDTLNPLFFFLAVFELTKALKVLSTALKIAFSDITEKVDICRAIFKNNFPEAENIQALMLQEIAQDFHRLNGDNNSDFGHKKRTEFYEYQSMTRTVLRILWFLRYIWQMFRYIQTTKDKLCDVMVRTYDVVLAPHHGWLLRKSAQLALKFAPDDRLPLFEGFFGNLIVFGFFLIFCFFCFNFLFDF